jgi:hypothetical protein
MREVVSTTGVQQEIEELALNGDFAAVFVRSTNTDDSGAEQENPLGRSHPVRG